MSTQIKIAVVLNPYKMRIYASCLGDFHLIKSMARYSDVKRKEIIATLTKAYEALGMTVDVKIITDTKEYRASVVDSVKRAVVMNAPIGGLEKESQELINKLCGGAFGATNNNAR